MDRENVIAANVMPKELKRKIKAEIRAAKQPKYTLGEEIFNSVTHGIGALFGIFAIIFGCIIVSRQPSGAKYAAIIASTIQAVFIMILCFSGSHQCGMNVLVLLLYSLYSK